MNSYTQAFRSTNAGCIFPVTTYHGGPFSTRFDTTQITCENRGKLNILASEVIPSISRNRMHTLEINQQLLQRDFDAVVNEALGRNAIYSYIEAISSTLHAVADRDKGEIIDSAKDAMGLATSLADIAAPDFTTDKRVLLVRAAINLAIDDRQCTRDFEKCLDALISAFSVIDASADFSGLSENSNFRLALSALTSFASASKNRLDIYKAAGYLTDFALNAAAVSISDDGWRTAATKVGEVAKNFGTGLRSCGTKAANDYLMYGVFRGANGQVLGDIADCFDSIVLPLYEELFTFGTAFQFWLKQTNFQKAINGQLLVEEILLDYYRKDADWRALAIDRGIDPAVLPTNCSGPLVCTDGFGNQLPRSEFSKLIASIVKAEAVQFSIQTYDHGSVTSDVLAYLLRIEATWYGYKNDLEFILQVTQGAAPSDREIRVQFVSKYLQFMQRAQGTFTPSTVRCAMANTSNQTEYRWERRVESANDFSYDTLNIQGWGRYLLSCAVFQDKNKPLTKGVGGEQIVQVMERYIRIEPDPAFANARLDYFGKLAPGGLIKFKAALPDIAKGQVKAIVVDWRDGSPVSVLRPGDSTAHAFMTSGEKVIGVTLNGTHGGAYFLTSRVLIEPNRKSACSGVVDGVMFSERFFGPLEESRWSVDSSGGVANSMFGILSFSTWNSNRFPYIEAKSNPFVGLRNFSFYCKADYTDAMSGSGTGPCVATAKVIKPGSAEWTYDTGPSIAVWGGGGVVTFGVSDGSRPLATTVSDAGLHEYEACINDAWAEIYVDGVLKAESALPEDWRVGYLWAGNPVVGGHPWAHPRAYAIEVRRLLQ